jgi:hypothetical protein
VIGIGVHTYYPALRPHPFGEQIEDAPGSTSNVDTSTTWTKVRPVDQRRALSEQLVGLTL